MPFLWTSVAYALGAASFVGLSVPPGTEAATLIEVTTYATTLTMNYLTHGRFIPHARRPRHGRRGEVKDTAHHADHRRARR